MHGSGITREAKSQRNKKSRSVSGRAAGERILLAMEIVRRSFYHKAGDLSMNSVQIWVSGTCMILVSFAIIAITAAGLMALERFYKNRGDDR